MTQYDHADHADHVVERDAAHAGDSRCVHRIDRLGDDADGLHQRVLSLEIQSLSKSIRRYLASTMPEMTRATGGNAHIIMFLARHRDCDVYQHDIERRFCITRSTASRVLSLMERKGLIVRRSVASDARLKKITLTATADSIVEELRDNAHRMEDKLVADFSQAERDRLVGYLYRLQSNIETAQRQADTHNAAADGTVVGEGANDAKTGEEPRDAQHDQTNEEDQ